VGPQRVVLFVEDAHGLQALLEEPRLGDTRGGAARSRGMNHLLNTNSLLDWGSLIERLKSGK
jgi:hypothetical protein